jgi:hypothetical protein
VDAIKAKSSTPAQSLKKGKHPGKKTSGSTGDYTGIYPNLGPATQLGLDVLDTMHKAHKISTDSFMSEQKKDEELAPFVHKQVEKEEEFISEYLRSNGMNPELIMSAFRIDS